MPTGRNMQLTKQAGEYLVASKLCRKGILATTFTGNVPLFDILALCEGGRAFTVQVKAIRGASWQFNIRSFLKIEVEDGKQVNKGRTQQTPRDLICVFVKLNENQDDQFYVFTWGDLQDYFSDNYECRQPPKKIDSFHCAVWPEELEKYRDNWQLIERVKSEAASADSHPESQERPA